MREERFSRTPASLLRFLQGTLPAILHETKRMVYVFSLIHIHSSVLRYSATVFVLYVFCLKTKPVYLFTLMYMLGYSVHLAGLQ